MIKVFDGIVFDTRDENEEDNFVLNEIFGDNNYRIPEDLSGKTVVDIGANIGAVSLLCAKRGARVRCFEPQPDNIIALNKNISLNGFDVDLVKKAVGKPGIAEITNKYGASSMTDFVKDKYGADDTAQVEVISLDEALKGIPHVDLLKIDCEGAEFDIIAGASESSLKKVDSICMEIHQPFQNNLIGDMVEKLLWHFNIEIEGSLVFCTPRKTI
jgi:FkbM family methyltransferase